MTFIDISRTIDDGVAVFEGDDPIAHSMVCDTDAESPCKITALGGWTTHLLTHVDAPRHFIAGGATMDEVPLDRFVLPAVVVEAPGPIITAAAVPSVLAGKAILFKTSNSQLDPATFHNDYVAIAADAVGALRDAGASLVGIDYLSVDKYGDEEYPAHRGLLGAGILILEGLDLSDVQAGEYELMALPLHIAAADGSPVRAVLRV